MNSKIGDTFECVIPGPIVNRFISLKYDSSNYFNLKTPNIRVHLIMAPKYTDDIKNQSFYYSKNSPIEAISKQSFFRNFVSVNLE